MKDFQIRDSLCLCVFVFKKIQLLLVKNCLSKSKLKFFKHKDTKTQRIPYLEGVEKAEVSLSREWLPMFSYFLCDLCASVVLFIFLPRLSWI